MDIFPELLHAGIITEVKRRLFDESVPRIKKCLAELSEEDVWYRPNEASNSVGNLVLHLCGNVQQWIVSGLGQAEDIRERDSEFAERGPLPHDHLIHLLETTMEAVSQTLDQTQPRDLLKVYTVQGFEEKGISILVHVVEHFSYHVGQITYFTKWKKAKDMGYYAGLDLTQKKKGSAT